jgi:hypothetical protein
LAFSVRGAVQCESSREDGIHRGEVIDTWGENFACEVCRKGGRGNESCSVVVSCETCSFSVAGSSIACVDASSTGSRSRAKPSDCCPGTGATVSSDPREIIESVLAQN